MKNAMTAAQKRAWMRALRSGKYEQGAGALKSTTNKYCCLGVAEAVCHISSKNLAFLKDKDRNLIFLEEEVQTELAGLNDKGVPFEMIAGVIDAWVKPEA